ncbi:Transcription factor YY2 [Porphyridium purpureum]|uniref:Transcription factor YY2 n=1 Tax=Porphyridium purpureum TaxID=35688 RepID=A0A5J4Z6H4_PORPP|nr:Transcription factor YY2 [Porphyridium purpureum]|eukprot:POR1315..scf295_1
MEDAADASGVSREPSLQDARVVDGVFECPYPACGRRFGKRFNLKAHLRKHSGELPFACDVCGKKYAWQSSLIAHRKHSLACVAAEVDEHGEPVLRKASSRRRSSEVSSGSSRMTRRRESDPMLPGFQNLGDQLNASRRVQLDETDEDLFSGMDVSSNAELARAPGTAAQVGPFASQVLSVPPGPPALGALKFDLDKDKRLTISQQEPIPPLEQVQQGAHVQPRTFELPTPEEKPAPEEHAMAWGRPQQQSHTQSHQASFPSDSTSRMPQPQHSQTLLEPAPVQQPTLSGGPWGNNNLMKRMSSRGSHAGRLLPSILDIDSDGMDTSDQDGNRVSPLDMMVASPLMMYPPGSQAIVTPDTVRQLTWAESSRQYQPPQGPTGLGLATGLPRPANGPPKTNRAPAPYWPNVNARNGPVGAQPAAAGWAYDSQMAEPVRESAEGDLARTAGIDWPSDRAPQNLHWRQ